MIKNEFEFLKTGRAKYSGFPQKVFDFIKTEQVCDKDLWKKFVDVFGTNVDNQDNGWRGEYFGKTMRGACLMYTYTGDEDLYEILSSVVKNILKKQDSLGRISTYDVKNEFLGWDVWGRKYVMVGLEYFYDICKDEDFKKAILEALIAHADYIVSHIGADKKPIQDTSSFYGGLNSFSILDAFLQLYKLTKFERYMEFAEYIISAGEHIITCVREGKLKVCEYPQTKAYELMSFFEGLLTYYECTGKESYLNIVLKFFDILQDTEQTIIGGMGTRHEFFDDSTVKQTEHSDWLMLETCVTVTWIRIMTRLLMLTGDVKYADRIELAEFNALYGSVNFDMISQYSSEKETYVPGLPFDSYAPLVANKRGLGVGGFKEFADGTHYGCCGCIGAAGVALMPLTAVLAEENGVVVNYYLNGMAQVELKSGNVVKVEIHSDYPRKGTIRVHFSSEAKEKYTIKLRIPDWEEDAYCHVNGREYHVDSGYLSFDDVSEDMAVSLTLPPMVKTIRLNGKTAFKCGPIVLCRDEEKEGREIDFGRKLQLEKNSENGQYMFREMNAKGDEYFRFKAKASDGSEMILTDYATCGKKWLEEHCRVSVWLNIE